MQRHGKKPLAGTARIASTETAKAKAAPVRLQRNIISKENKGMPRNDTAQPNSQPPRTVMSNRATSAVTASRRMQTKKVPPRRRRQQQSPHAPMRDPFLSYMHEISQGEILDQQSVIDFANKIREGVQIERTQAALTSKFGRKPVVAELAEFLGATPELIQRRLNLGLVAKNDLVSANLRLVTSVARKIQATKTSTLGLALDDMIQEGNVGLIRAAEKYDVSRGYRFSTYATWWVRASILRAITTQSRAIKIPTTVVEEYVQIQRERTRLIAEGTLHPSDNQIAASLGITTAKLRFISSVVARPPISLDVSVTEQGPSQDGRTLGELLIGDGEMEERMVERMQRQELDAVLKTSLKPMERAAIRLRFGLEDGHPRTLREVGELLSLSRERVRQHVFSALSKLRTPEVRQFLVNYLG